MAMCWHPKFKVCRKEVLLGPATYKRMLQFANHRKTAAPKKAMSNAEIKALYAKNKPTTAAPTPSKYSVSTEPEDPGYHHNKVPSFVEKTESKCLAGLQKFCHNTHFEPGQSDKHSAKQCNKCAKQHLLTLTAEYECTLWEVQYLCGKIHANSLAAAYRKEFPASNGKVMSFVKAGFRPIEGFQIPSGETAACLLDKAEQVVDVLHALANCEEFTPEPGLCYNKRVQSLAVHTRLCCQGNEHLVLHSHEVACSKATRPLVAFLLKNLLPQFIQCTEDPKACAGPAKHLAVVPFR